MTLTEKLRSLGLAGITALAMSGCYDNQYHFNGKIEGENVVFWEEGLGIVHILKVKRIDGSIVTYREGIQSYLGSVRIQPPNSKEKFYKISQYWAKPILAKAQKQYDDYLKKIIETKTVEGLSALKPNLR